MSTPAALGLIRALAAQGDRAGALQFANVHAALVRQHLETEPAAEVEAWIARLRAGDLPSSSPAPAPSRPRPDEAGDGGDAAERELGQIARILSERFEVGERAGRSTLLLTFAARDRRDTRPVELHVLRPRLGALSDAARVVDALERVAALHDPRIVPVRDCGVLQGLIYYTTPPVEGLSLRDRLARERLTRHYVHRLEQLGHQVRLEVSAEPPPTGATGPGAA